jgi:hypothetical protein
VKEKVTGKVRDNTLQREKKLNLLEGSKLGPLALLISRDNQLICNTKDTSDKYAIKF